MFGSSFFGKTYYGETYFPPITSEFVAEVLQHGGDSSKKIRSKRKIYTTKDIYAALRKARERAEEVGLTPKTVEKRQKVLEQAEKQVRDRLQAQYGRVQGKDVSQEGLVDFVSALRFGEGLGEMPQEDMEQVLLIILIDEWTNE